MVYTHFGRVTKQWWGASHLRIGSRGQPRPNKGFRVTQLPSLGSAIECCRSYFGVKNAADVDIDLNSLGAFATYYTGNYEICEAPRVVKDLDGKSSNVPGGCATGVMHATVVFRQKVMSSYTQVYLVLCLERPADASSKLWNSVRFGPKTYKRDNRVYIGFSSLEFTNQVDTLYMSGLSAALGPPTSRGPLKSYWPSAALELDFWNEVSGKSSHPVCSYNVFFRQPLPHGEQVSLHELEGYYIAGIQRYVLKDYEYISKTDYSRMNIFNSWNTDAPQPALSVAEVAPVPAGDASLLPNSSTNAVHSVSPNKLVDAIQGTLKSTDCGVSIAFSGKERDTFYGNALVDRFSAAFVIKSLLEVFLLCTQLRRADEGAQGQSLSIVAFSMLSFQEVFEIFVLIFHRIAFMYRLLVLCFMLFVKVFLLVVVYHYFLVLIWRANHAVQIREGWEATQKRFALFYRYYFSFLFMQGTLWYFYYVEGPWILIFNYLGWVPQILLDAWRGQCNSLSMSAIILLMFCRLYVPFYLFMLKENAFTHDVFVFDNVRTNRTVGGLIMVATLLQLILMCLQRLFGARCFAMWSILPQIYTYVRPWTSLMQDDPQECAICMSEIEQSKR
ncbi:zinc finger protein [Babesia caballi]|uniref:RING-type E3 ubiquitin transferase n=1 Tax=Babesia caballi TaxID=5871 RepID=A0AAV4LPH9_BABCB|nr:zinc finger protein [Babesia caballi]